MQNGVSEAAKRAGFRKEEGRDPLHASYITKTEVLGVNQKSNVIYTRQGPVAGKLSKNLFD